MDALSDRINSLPVSATLAMAAKARELKNKGVDIIGLSLGEPDFNTPEYIKDAAIQAVKDNYNSYSPVDGYADLKEAICTKFERDNQLNYKPSQIVVSTGAKQSIANLCMVLLNPGDEVLLPAPYWVSYSAIATLAEAKSNHHSIFYSNGFQDYSRTIGSGNYTEDEIDYVQFAQQPKWNDLHRGRIQSPRKSIRKTS